MNNSIPAINVINSILRNGIKEYIEEKSGITILITLKEFNRILVDESWTRSSSVEVLSLIRDTGQVSGMGKVVSSRGGITITYTESFQYTLGDKRGSFKTSIEGVHTPWMLWWAKVVERIGDEEETPLDWGTFPAIFSKVDYALTKVGI